MTCSGASHGRSGPVLSGTFCLRFGTAFALFFSMRKPSRKNRETKQPPLPEWPDPIKGGKYLKLLQTHVRQLRAEHPHGNQQLFADDVILAHLLAFFNPT